MIKINGFLGVLFRKIKEKKISSCRLSKLDTHTHSISSETGKNSAQLNKHVFQKYSYRYKWFFSHTFTTWKQIALLSVSLIEISIESRRNCAVHFKYRQNVKLAMHNSKSLSLIIYKIQFKKRIHVCLCGKCVLAKHVSIRVGVAECLLFELEVDVLFRYLPTSRLVHTYRLENQTQKTRIQFISGLEWCASTNW